jgi:hypothetical protein
MKKRITYKIIDNASDCSVSVFMKCMFNKSYELLIIKGRPSKIVLKNAWKDIHSEYIDVSGLAINEEFDKMIIIYHLENRTKAISTLLWIQRTSIAKRKYPHFEGFEKLHYYGHVLTWDNKIKDTEGFLKQLSDIESQELVYQSELDDIKRELEIIQKTKEHVDEPVIERRRRFVRMLNNLRRADYKIDEDKTSAEALALMIHDYGEFIQEQSMK